MVLERVLDDELAVEREARCGELRLDAGGHLEWRAHLSRNGARDLVRARDQSLMNLRQISGALSRRSRGPAIERRACRRDRSIYIFRGPFGNASDDLLG